MTARKPIVLNVDELEQLQSTDDITLSGRSIIGILAALFAADLALGNLNAAKTIDWTLSAVQVGTLNQDCVITIDSFPGVGRYQLRLVNLGGFKVTWAGIAYSDQRWVDFVTAPRVNPAVNGETVITFSRSTASTIQMMGWIGAAMF